MTIYLGADHGGWEYKNQIREHLTHLGHTVIDCGAVTLDEDDDYPRYAYAVSSKLLGDTSEDPRGILVCGSGEGMAIAANRVRGIRAMVAWGPAVARESRQDNDSNVLSLPARFLDIETTLATVDAWIETPFSNEDRHLRRLEQIEELYG